MEDERRKETEKRFIRIIKELGIFSIWKIERKKYVNTKPKADYLFKSDYFSNIIAVSFVWVRTKHTDMWKELAIFGFPTSVIIANQHHIDKLKEIIKKHL